MTKLQKKKQLNVTIHAVENAYILTDNMTTKVYAVTNLKTVGDLIQDYCQHEINGLIDQEPEEAFPEAYLKGTN
jgi:hypothetical protein